MDDRKNPVPDLNRRLMLGIAGVAAAGVAVGAKAATVEPSHGEIVLHGRTIRFADLTHRLTKVFNFGQKPPRIAFEPIDGSGKAVGMALNRIELVEHTGTHIDAPRHFSTEGASLGEVPIGDLVVPLAILDLRGKFAVDNGATVEPADIEAWERRHGRLPTGCCLAMWTGFDPSTSRPAGPPRIPPGPGFGPEVLELLISRRSVKGVAVDSMSIDSSGHVPQYPFHKAWLSSGRWGIEGLTNLATPPGNGAVLIVGAPPIEDATGMPIRAVAMF